MKKILFLFAVSAFASVSEAKLAHQWPLVNMEGQGVPVNNICTTGTYLRTKNPVNICVETKVVSRMICRLGETEICRPYSEKYPPYPSEYVKEQTTCAQYVPRQLQVARAYETNVCTKWKAIGEDWGGTDNCTQYTRVQKMLPEEYMVPISDPTHLNDNHLPAMRYALDKCLE